MITFGHFRPRICPAEGCGTLHPLALLLVVFLAASASVRPAIAGGASPFGKTVREQVGVNIHFTDAMPGEMDELAGAGFGFIRMDFVWSSIEKQPGVYDFSHYDKLLADLESKNMRALWILDYGNPLYDNNGHPVSDAARSAFAAWAGAAVQHFKGHHILWEMWNEPNYGNWTADYLKLALATGQAIKALAPSETYIGPAEGGDDPAYLETLFQGGALNYWDAVSVHPYRHDPPETSVPELKTLQSLIAKYEPAGANIPLISGEWGYSVIPNGNTYSWVTSDAQQAQYFDREMLSNLSIGLPLSIWYDWRNDNDKPGDTESNFGLVLNPYNTGQSPVFTPKPSYFAAQTFLSTLGNYEFDSDAPVSGSTGASLFTFKQRRERRYAIYTTAAAPETVTLQLPPGKYNILDISGNVEQTVNVGSAGLPLTVSGDVQFVVGTK